VSYVLLGSFVIRADHKTLVKLTPEEEKKIPYCKYQNDCNHRKVGRVVSGDQDPGNPANWRPSR